MIIHSILSILLISTTCYTMDTQEEPSSKRYKSSAADEIITALFEKFDQDPIDESSIVQLITQLKSQTCIDSSCFTRRQLDGDTLLLKAVNSGSYQLVAELLSLPACKAIIDTQNIHNTYTPLAVAIENRNNQLVKLLLDNGANPNQRFKNTVNENCFPAQYARVIENLEALRLLIGKKGFIMDFLRNISIRTNPPRIKLVGDAKNILLEGISEKQFLAFYDNEKLDPYIDQPFQNEGQALENLMLAFAQKKTTVLKNLLAQSTYKNILLKNDNAGRSLFSLANHLAFDTTRVRTELEEHEHLPIWQDQALMIGKPVVKWILMTFTNLAKTHQTSLPNDMIFLVLSFVIGRPLLINCMQTSVKTITT